MFEMLTLRLLGSSELNPIGIRQIPQRRGAILLDDTLRRTHDGLCVGACRVVGLGLVLRDDGDDLGYLVGVVALGPPNGFDLPIAAAGILGELASQCGQCVPGGPVGLPLHPVGFGDPLRIVAAAAEGRPYVVGGDALLLDQRSVDGGLQSVTEGPVAGLNRSPAGGGRAQRATELPAGHW
ncbi:hypothetical protein [Mycolicibacterium insubricum]|uniref:hypothetical protein n=1 Tax=Mycolicibacterium insubricum TaxID=444597 RepID=UPI0021F3BC47|nr:hypothetical protein [Mycolicibacterium insubricum]MCV7080066.1 hypothetical protein [Mycolicibacterium insubricum]